MPSPRLHRFDPFSPDAPTPVAWLAWGAFFALTMAVGLVDWALAIPGRVRQRLASAAPDGGCGARGDGAMVLGRGRMKTRQNGSQGGVAVALDHLMAKNAELMRRLADDEDTRGGAT